MKDVRYYLGWLLVILPLHGVEQFMFGFDELYELQGQVGTVVDLFPTRDAGIVFVVFAVVMLVMTFMYFALGSGRSRLVGFAFFGISGLIESHHVIKTIVQLDYFPGAVTALPFVLVGGLLLRAVVREWRSPAACASFLSAS
jgi:hypothetical protein